MQRLEIAPGTWLMWPPGSPPYIVTQISEAVARRILGDGVAPHLRLEARSSGGRTRGSSASAIALSRSAM
jgi:hypothetical protein